MTHTPRLNTASPFLPQGQQMPIPQALQIAAQQIDAGRLPPAEAILRQILDKLPTHAEALHLMGVLAYQAGKAELAVELIGKAIASKPITRIFTPIEVKCCVCSSGWTKQSSMVKQRFG